MNGQCWLCGPWFVVRSPCVRLALRDAIVFACGMRWNLDDEVVGYYVFDLKDDGDSTGRL